MKESELFAYAIKRRLSEIRNELDKIEKALSDQDADKIVSHCNLTISFTRLAAEQGRKFREALNEEKKK